MEQEWLSCFAPGIRQALKRCSAQDLNSLQEVRVRVQRPVELCAGYRSYFLQQDGRFATHPEKGLVATVEDGRQMMNLISQHSVYALEEELRRGYITIRGGHRIGLAGRAVVENGRVRFLKEISSFNVRIARQITGVARPIMHQLLKRGRFLSTLIISPPGCGKTTLLRDLARVLSKGDVSIPVQPHKVGLVDERSEVAGCVNGLPQHDVGPRTDVLDACPKAEGMMMLIRSMSPDVVACDEIGSHLDAMAIQEALHAGVSLLATAHGTHVGDIRGRPHLAPVFEQHIFSRYILLSRRRGAGTVECILDENERKVWPEIGGGIRHCLN